MATGGGVSLGKIELLETGRLSEKEAKRNMEKCAEFLARMIQKYGNDVLAELEVRKEAKGVVQ